MIISDAAPDPKMLVAAEDCGTEWIYEVLQVMLNDRHFQSSASKELFKRGNAFISFEKI